MDSDPLSQFDGQLIDGLEFCRKVYLLFEDVSGRPNGRSRLRMRSTELEKRLIEELLPICRYVQTNYRLGRYISIRWINGDQTYDAEMYQEGAYVCDNYYPQKAHLEVTCAMHQKDYLRREMLETHGYAYHVDGIERTPDGDVKSEPKMQSGSEFVQPFARILNESIRKKSEKPYPGNTTLIIDCSLNYLYLEDEWRELMGLVRDNLPDNQFAEIFIQDDMGRRSESIFPDKA